MAVRVRARILNPEAKTEVETTLLLNTGYESAGPKILLPERLAEKLGIPIGSQEVEARTSLGMGRLYAPGLKVLVEVGGRRAEAEVRISRVENEAIANDALIEELGIEILRAGKGVYRFSGETTERKSETPEYW